MGTGILRTMYAAPMTFLLGAGRFPGELYALRRPWDKHEHSFTHFTNSQSMVPFVTGEAGI